MNGSLGIGEIAALVHTHLLIRSHSAYSGHEMQPASAGDATIVMHFESRHVAS